MFWLAVRGAGPAACWALSPEREESRELNSKEKDGSGAPGGSRSRGLQGSWVLQAVNLNGAGDWVDVALCVAAVQGTAWWEL